MVLALIKAFSKNVSPSSIISPLNPKSSKDITSKSKGFSACLISKSLCALFVAKTIFFMKSPLLYFIIKPLVLNKEG